MHIHANIVGVCTMHSNQVHCRIILPLLEDDFEQAAKLSALAM
jgi:hypothetical protein